MAAFYQDFKVLRTTEPDFLSLVATLRVVEPTAGPVVVGAQRYRVKTSTRLSVQQIEAMQAAIESTPSIGPTLSAQNAIDAWPIELRAMAMALVDQLNVIRGRLSPPLPVITPAQVLQAIRDKAGTL